MTRDTLILDAQAISVHLAEIPVLNTVMAFIGAPFFLYILLKGAAR